MRATNFSFLNDPSEIEYGRALAREVLVEARKKASRAHKPFFTELARQFDLETGSEVYVSCFTALDDDLSQWRAYGSASAERYALGFDAEVLQALAIQREGAQFTRVVYDHEEQLERLEFVTDKALAFVQHEQPSDAELDLLAVAAARQLARVLPQLKNPAYAAEKEWRVVLWHPLPDQQIEFDASRAVVRPFLRLSLPAPLPLLALLVMAPSREAQALKAAEMLLRVVGVDVTPRHSHVPFAE